MTILDAMTSQKVTANRIESAIKLAERRTAHNYSPLPVVAASAVGAWITDVDGRRLTLLIKRVEGRGLPPCGFFDVTPGDILKHDRSEAEIGATVPGA